MNNTATEGPAGPRPLAAHGGGSIPPRQAKCMEFNGYQPGRSLARRSSASASRIRSLTTATDKALSSLLMGADTVGTELDSEVGGVAVDDIEAIDKDSKQQKKKKNTCCFTA